METTMMSAHANSESRPRTFSGVGGTPWAPCSDSRIAYSWTGADVAIDDPERGERDAPRKRRRSCRAVRRDACGIRPSLAHLHRFIEDSREGALSTLAQAAPAEG